MSKTNKHSGSRPELGQMAASLSDGLKEELAQFCPSNASNKEMRTTLTLMIDTEEDRCVDKDDSFARADYLIGLQTQLRRETKQIIKTLLGEI